MLSIQLLHHNFWLWSPGTSTNLRLSDHRMFCDHQLPAPTRELWSPRVPWSPTTSTYFSVITYNQAAVTGHVRVIKLGIFIWTTNYVSFQQFLDHIPGVYFVYFSIPSCGLRWELDFCSEPYLSCGGNQLNSSTRLINSNKVGNYFTFWKSVSQ